MSLVISRAGTVERLEISIVIKHSVGWESFLRDLISREGKQLHEAIRKSWEVFLSSHLSKIILTTVFLLSSGRLMPLLALELYS